MAKPDLEDGDEARRWDDTVDVICVGTSPGVLAYAICCAAADLDVLVVDAPAHPDQRVTEWYAAMTEDLGDPVPGEEVNPRQRSSREVVEPFVGEELRQWSARCLASPAAVMFTQIPDVLVPAIVGGRSVTAAVIGTSDGPLEHWLRAKADELGVAEPESAIRRVLVDEGRIAAVELADGTTVGATGGLAFPAGPADAGLPGQAVGQVALVGRRAGRFARVEFTAAHD